MKLFLPKIFFLSSLIYLFSFIGNPAFAQSILARKVSMHVSDQPLRKVLEFLEQKGAFRLSYSSKTIPGDSVVSLQAESLTIKEVLDVLFKNQFEYKETENFVILRYAPLSLLLLTEKASGDEDSYTISGYVLGEGSGKKLNHASVYERNLAKGTLTDENGHFEIELHHINEAIALSVSKENYKDATYFFLKEVNIQQSSKRKSQDFFGDDFDDIADAGLAKFFISTKQRIQSLNIRGVIARAPYQASLTPAINTHGSISGQIMNQLSLNLIGGYNAGVVGFEMGGLFNLNRTNVKGVQFAGLFNVAGGSVSGIQLAGIKNDVNGNRSGLQVAGLYNKVQKNSSGVQIAGLFNRVHGKASGVQMAGIYNQADTSSGFRFGLVNIAKSSEGYNFGLLNFIGNGFNTLSFGYNETIDFNIALRTGTDQLYTIWYGGTNLRDDHKLYAFGLGFGSAMKISNRWSLNPELSCRYLYQGVWHQTNLLNRFDLNANFRMSKTFTMTTGPSINISYSDQNEPKENYSYVQRRSDAFNLNNNKLRGWFGWGVAITIF